MKEQIKTILEAILKKLELNVDMPIEVEVPNDRSHGDFSSNVALKLAKVAHKSPMVLAEEIKDNIDSPLMTKVEVVAPGFLNFFVRKEYLLENVNRVLEEKERYGSKVLDHPSRINLEFVSANPTGILHLGHARGAAFGDSLARILTFAGYDVTREYYINDAGNQMNLLGESIRVRYRNLCGIEEELPENGYHGKEIIAIAETIYEQFQDTVIKEEISFFKKKGLSILLEQIQADLDRFGVHFDKWSSEEELYNTGQVKKVLDTLVEKDYTYELDGACFLKTSLYGDEKDRVLIKQDKNSTYLLPDIAYHKSKYDRGYDTCIDVLGADHHGYISRLKASLAMLDYDPEKLHVMILQMVRLLQNGEEVKMSKRTGKSVTISELIDEVGADITRYFFVARSLDSQMDFDLDLAIKQSNENPVYYINYAHARICSILNNQEEIKKIEEWQTITSDAAYNVLEKVYEWNETVANAASHLEVHLITNYAYDLASLFHTYYASEKIITDDPIYTKEHLALIKAVQITLENALELIGLHAYEKM